MNIWHHLYQNQEVEELDKAAFLFFNSTVSHTSSKANPTLATMSDVKINEI